MGGRAAGLALIWVGVDERYSIAAELQDFDGDGNLDLAALVAVEP